MPNLRTAPGAALWILRPAALSHISSPPQCPHLPVCAVPRVLHVFVVRVHTQCDAMRCCGSFDNMRFDGAFSENPAGPHGLLQKRICVGAALCGTVPVAQMQPAMQPQHTQRWAYRAV